MYDLGFVARVLKLIIPFSGTFNRIGTISANICILKSFFDSYEKCGQRIADKIAENFSSACLVVVSTIICQHPSVCFMFACNLIIKVSISTGPTYI
jgi:hypothetical protein